MEIEKICNDLEEHLNAINENTSEIQALFDYLREIEVKMEKLAQRVDALQLSLGGSHWVKPYIAPLDQTEKNVFLALYTEETPLSYAEIALKADLPKAIIPECLSSLIDKGLPLQRSFYNNQLFFRLDPHFKERQTKEKIVNLSLQSFM